MARLTQYERELIERSRSGDTQSFARVVDRYQAFACALALSATRGDVALSEDVCQEAFVTAWTQLGDLRQPEKFSSWLAGIIRNTARYHLRHQRRHAPDAGHGAEDTAPVPSNQPTPLEHAIARQELALLARVLGSIPSRYREPLVLFYRYGESIKTVASDLGLSEAAVKQRLSRGRRFLQAGVEQDLAGALRTSRPKVALGSAVIGLIALLPRTGQAASASVPWLGLTKLVAPVIVAVTVWAVVAVQGRVSVAPAAPPTSTAVAADPRPATAAAGAVDPERRPPVTETREALEADVIMGRGRVRPPAADLEPAAAPAGQSPPASAGATRLRPPDTGPDGDISKHGPAVIIRPPDWGPSVSVDEARGF